MLHSHTTGQCCFGHHSTSHIAYKLPRQAEYGHVVWMLFKGLRQPFTIMVDTIGCNLHAG